MRRLNWAPWGLLLRVPRILSPHLAATRHLRAVIMVPHAQIASVMHPHPKDMSPPLYDKLRKHTIDPRKSEANE